MALEQIRSKVRKESVSQEVISNYYKLIWEKRPIYVYTFDARLADNKQITNPFDLRENFYQFMSQHPKLRVYGVNRVVFDEQQFVYTLDRFHSDKFDGHIGMFKKKAYITLKYKEQLLPDRHGNITKQHAEAYQAVILSGLRMTDAQLTADSFYGARNAFVHLPSGTFVVKELGPNLRLCIFQGLFLKVKLNIDRQLVVNTSLIHRILEKYHMGVLEYFLAMHNVEIGGNTDEEVSRREARIRNMTFTHRGVEQFNNDMRGKPVSTIYAPRHYKIEGVVDEYPNTTWFKTNDGQKENVTEYLSRRYNIRLQFPNLPLVKMMKSKKNPILIPMECLQISLKPRKHMGDLSAYMETILREVRKDPHEFFTGVRDMLKTAQIKDVPETSAMNEFGIKLDKNMIRTEATVLPLPEVTRFAETPKWKVRIVPVYMSDNYAGDSSNIIQFLRDLQTKFDTILPQPGHFSVDTNLEMASFDPKHLVDLYKKYHDDDQYTLLLTFLPENRLPRDKNRLKWKADLYSQIKTLCDANPYCGIPNQCINIGTLRRCIGMNSFVLNIVRKIYSKLGGKASLINADFDDAPSVNQLFKEYGRKSTMFLGIFSSKSPKKDKLPSVHTMAYNVDPEASCYVGVHAYQRDHLDKINAFYEMFFECLEGFFAEIGAPQRILIFRGGLCDSVIDEIAEYEESQINKAITNYRKDTSFKEEVKNWDPKICYLDVSRSQSRFTIDAGSCVYENLKPGTVIDKDVVETANDFIMASHEGRLGTTRPAEYSLKFSTWPESDMLDIKVLCNNLCHLLGRSLYTVALPAPIRMANFLAKRCREFKLTHPDKEFEYQKFPYNSKMTAYFT